MSEFPTDWDEWRRAWHEWRDANDAQIGRTGYQMPGKNFLADDVLGVFRINGRNVELSEVTMPDFSKGYGGDRVRFVGITYGTAAGIESGGVVASFAELEETLGMS